MKVSETWIMKYIERVLVDFDKYRWHHNTVMFAVVVLSDEKASKAILEAWKDSPEICETMEDAMNRCKKVNESDFALVNKDAVITFYSMLEVGVDDLIKTAFLEDPEFFKDSRLSKIKVSGHSLLVNDKDIISEEFCQEYERVFKRNGDKDIPYGFDRFASLLKPIIGEFSLDKDSENAITELAQIRNVYVHKAGVADRKFIDACPWLSQRIPVNQKISTSVEDIDRYCSACIKFTEKIRTSIIKRFTELTQTSDNYFIKYQNLH